MTVNAKKNPGYAIALAGAVVLSFTGPFIAYLSGAYGLPPLVLSFWRQLFVFLLLLLVLGLKAPRALARPLRRGALLVCYGGILAVFNASWTLSVALNGASLATFLLYISPVFTALWGSLFGRETLGGLRLLCLALSLAGCLLLSGVVSGGADAAAFRGVAWGLFSGAAYALYTIFGRRVGSGPERGGLWGDLCWTFGVAAGCLWLFNRFGGAGAVGTTRLGGDLFFLGTLWRGWAVLLILAGGPTLLGFGLYNLSLRYLPPLPVSLIVSSEPVFTAVLAFLFLGETLTFTAAGGGALILTAVILVQAEPFLGQG